MGKRESEQARPRWTETGSEERGRERTPHPGSGGARRAAGGGRCAPPAARRGRCSRREPAVPSAAAAPRSLGPGAAPLRPLREGPWSPQRQRLPRSPPCPAAAPRASPVRGGGRGGGPGGPILPSARLQLSAAGSLDGVSPNPDFLPSPKT